MNNGFLCNPHKLSVGNLVEIQEAIENESFHIEDENPVYDALPGDLFIVVEKCEEINYITVSHTASGKTTHWDMTTFANLFKTVSR